MSLNYKSQYNQDRFCYENFLRHVPYKGFFVEVGASDGVKFSNTYFYEKELGWTGLCIEPRKKAFPELLKNRDCFCENVGIGPEFKEGIEFLEMEGYGEGMSGIVSNYHPNHANIIERHIKTNENHKNSFITTIDTVPLQHLLDKYAIPHIHFLSVDTEGGELEILKTVSNLGIVDVITVENNYGNDRYFSDYLKQNGFRKIAKLEIDEIYVNFSFLASLLNQLPRKIAFISPWADNEQLQKEYSTTLPNGRNWKNLIPSSTKETEYLVVMEGVPIDKEREIYGNKDKTVICFPREPPEINPVKNYEKYNLRFGFTYSQVCHSVPQFNFLQTDIRELDKIKYDKTKTVSCILSGKQHTAGAVKRLSYAERVSLMVDIFGRDLPNGLGNGPIKSKMEGLIPYKYSICMENSQHSNYFTEKFTDAIVCWCVPIYWGCPNISSYFPPESYYTIDIESKTPIEDLKRILDRPVNMKALNHARNLVLSEYNLWNRLDRVVNYEEKK